MESVQVHIANYLKLTNLVKLIYRSKPLQIKALQVVFFSLFLEPKHSPLHRDLSKDNPD